MAASDGLYRLEYHGGNGWWVGHAGIDIDNIEAYVYRVQCNGTYIRAINKQTGEIIGDAVPCTMCGEIHEGVDGSCLL